MKKIIIFIILSSNIVIAADKLLVYNKGTKLNGTYLLAWNIAYNDFIKLNELTKEKKCLKYYNIFFGEKEKNYIIRFDGKLMNKKNMQKYNRMIFGKEVKYLINKKDFTITERLFFK